MATFRVVFEFTESNGASFNEVYYRDSTDAPTAVTVTPNTLASRLALLHPLNTFQRVRASQVDANRVTATAPVSLPGTANMAGGPLPVGDAAILQLSGAAGGSRKLWMRGIPAAWYVRDPVSGRDAPPPAFLDLIQIYVNNLGFNGFGIRRLMPAGVGLLARRKIVKVAPNLMAGLADVTLDLAPGYPVPGRVVIGGASKKDLPSMNGHWSITAVNALVVTIPYQVPNNGTVLGGNGTMRQESYFATSVFVQGRPPFDHYGTRTSRNPLSRSRGARRAARLRSLV